VSQEIVVKDVKLSDGRVRDFVIKQEADGVTVSCLTTADTSPIPKDLFDSK